jgi:molybdopterin molybdotransferase
MLDVSEALDLILQHTCVLPSQRTELSMCLDLVTAESLKTPHDSPPFDKSMMDGFAVDSRRALPGDRAPLRVIETITAGTVPVETPGEGTASRIMTGAPLPDQADCVVPIEDVVFDDSKPDTVGIALEQMIPERHVLRKGALAVAGSDLLPAGTELKPQHIAVLAEFGVAQVPVIRRPRVAVLATGDELIDTTEVLTAGKIRNSNEPMLVAQVRRAGATPVPLGIVRDERHELRGRIQEGLSCDVLLLSGGVSAGTLDLVPSVLTELGVEQVFHKIRMKPGKPLWFGVLDSPDQSCLVLGLPGNPVSSMVCFESFGRPMLGVMAGRTPQGRRNQQAILTQDIAIRGDRPTYFPSTLVRASDGLTVTPVAWGGSADLRSTALANGVACLEPKPAGYQVGDLVPVQCWDAV